MPARRSYRHAGVLTVVTVVTLSALLYFDPDLATRLMREDHAIEWLQVALFAAAAVSALVAARRPPSALDLLLALLFAGFVELEVDLDRRLFGRPLIDKRFLLDGSSPLLPRLLTALVLLGVAIAVMAYVWRRRAEIVRAASALLRAPWGRVLLIGLGLLVVVEVFEKSLGGVLELPKYFLEESLELIAALWCFVALFDHARHDGR
jgi:hypothetical protein